MIEQFSSEDQFSKGRLLFIKYENHDPAYDYWIVTLFHDAALTKTLPAANYDALFEDSLSCEFNDDYQGYSMFGMNPYCISIMLKCLKKAGYHPVKKLCKRMHPGTI